MAKITVATIFPEFLEKELKNHLPLGAITAFMLMADQIQQLEKAVQIVHDQNLKLMKMAVLSNEYKAALAAQNKEFEDTVKGDNVLMERARRGDMDEV